MCGIMGIFTGTGQIDLGGINLSALKNRGPDNVGRWIGEPVGFYHTRLAVIDTKQSSNQPILTSNDNLVLVCNGEIYNYKELKAQSDYAYQTSSDCETIASCYDREGISGFKKLRGMFAFGLYDRRRKKILIHRDPVGKKPLFYYAKNGIFVFASTVSAIKENLPHALSLNAEALSSYMQNGYVRPDRSMYESIQPLLPGMILEFDIFTQECLQSYVAPDEAPAVAASDGEIFAQTEKLLDQSITRRLQGIEKPVLLFSGGIDSTVLAKKMLALSGKRLTCIGLRPLVPLTYDDFFARYAANKLGAQYLSCGFSVRTLLDDLNRAIDLLDQPLSLYSYYSLVYLTRQARNFGNVLFLGEGGDEVFYGYSNIQAWFNSVSKQMVDLKVGPPILPDISDWGRQQMTGELLGHSFVKTDKSTAEQQMEARCPYLDWDLMAWMRRIPADYFLKSNKTKPLLKQMLGDFPHWFLERPKVGTAFNFRYLLLPFYRKLYERTNFNQLRSAGINCRGFECFRPVEIFKRFDDFWKLYVLSNFLKK